MASPQQQSLRQGQMPRGQYGGNFGASGYRGTAAASSAPYTFKATPQLRHETRSASAPMASSGQPLTTGHSNRQRYPAPDSVSTTSSATSSDPSGGVHHPYSKDDALLFTNFQVPAYINDSGSVADIHVASTGSGQPLGQHIRQDSSPKSSPDRYRRGHQRNQSSTGSGSSLPSPFDSITGTTSVATATLAQIYQSPQQIAVASQKTGGGGFRANAGVQVHSEDSGKGEVSPINGTTALPQPTSSELPKRYRGRRSFGSIDASAKVAPGAPSITTQVVPSSASLVQNSAFQEARPTTPAGQGYRPSSSSSNARSFTSADAVRRINNPSPLSKPMHTNEIPPYLANSPTSALSQSPAVAAMAALNERDANNKGVKSRLRRAFSFGSTAELKRASGEIDPAADRARARREQFSTELDDDQEAVAQRQEATGLGQGIYSTQSHAFAGSIDNLSISSTASSASLMLRKMGKGVKKGGRSLKGLFRPKSVIGVPSADAELQASVGPVSRVTVEAEREQVNVNANPHDQAGGGTGFPKLERNSIDAARMEIGSRGDGQASQASEGRRSIVGGEQERTEVLEAVRRGILKRSATGSPVATPVPFYTDGTSERRGPNFGPNFGTNFDRNPSPAPSNTSSEFRRTGHRRTESSNMDTDDYFATITNRYPGGQTSRSIPGTPRGMPRNISFSPRIQFHDVWSSTEYDRRGDVATCNRLTPMLAQQIKEELNNFKMEMEVHEQSKLHTHFF